MYIRSCCFLPTSLCSSWIKNSRYRRDASGYFSKRVRTSCVSLWPSGGCLVKICTPIFFSNKVNTQAFIADYKYIWMYNNCLVRKAIVTQLQNSALCWQHGRKTIRTSWSLFRVQSANLHTTSLSCSWPRVHTMWPYGSEQDGSLWMPSAISTQVWKNRTG